MLRVIKENNEKYKLNKLWQYPQVLSSRDLSCEQMVKSHRNGGYKQGSRGQQSRKQFASEIRCFRSVLTELIAQSHILKLKVNNAAHYYTFFLVSR